eukprot:9486354-Pyramimonas_sp.AAC.2
MTGSHNRYVFLNVLVATCIAGGVCGFVAWLMYNDDTKSAKLSMWRIPDTVFGDLLVSTLGASFDAR